MFVLIKKLPAPAPPTALSATCLASTLQRYFLRFHQKIFIALLLWDPDYKGGYGHSFGHEHCLIHSVGGALTSSFRSIPVQQLGCTFELGVGAKRSNFRLQRLSKLYWNLTWHRSKRRTLKAPERFSFGKEGFQSANSHSDYCLTHVSAIPDMRGCKQQTSTSELLVSTQQRHRRGTKMGRE